MEINIQHIEENVESLELLGKGSNGMAFRIEINGIDFVLKLTSSESEYKIAARLKKYQNKNPKYISISSEIVAFGGFKRFKLFFTKLKHIVKTKNKTIDLDSLPINTLY